MLVMFLRRVHEREKVTGNETNHRSALIPACMPEHLDNILLSEYALGWQTISIAGCAKYN
jgi:hypothetical protein